MARPPSFSSRVLGPAAADHAGRHRRARLTRPADEDEDSGPEAEESLPFEGGTGDRPAVDHGVADGHVAEPGQDRTTEPKTGDTGAVGVPVFSVPDSLRSVDVAVGGRAVRGLLLVAVVLLLTLGGRWWWVSQHAVGAPVEQVVGAGATSSPEQESAEDRQGRTDQDAPEGGETTSGAEGPAATAVLMVHVVGKVHEPGVVELPPGSRVVDAIQAAGGLTDAADPASLNLARLLVDGEQVWVGAPGEEPPPGLQVPFSPPAAGGGGGPGGPGAGQPSDGAGAGSGQGTLLVDLNLADQALLEELPGVGPVTAGNILAWRDQHGRFTAVEELMEVSGIGEKTFEQLRPHVTVGG
ncbi:helix-hairpin-helix domain-containing protein [Ornithinimicrobium sufpigmenti]|uniref:helix-hairpin-helix domain-containing protein n=1 Tax=Ornithinimicrobium sufpigmenti TaxID=2508882 RepID=UPI001EDD48C5|nr:MULTISPECIES: helix-hairpin-helix domain-containing protein [unclassified Ornithinimicrobium]